ncbi:hypothetical protein [Lewinella sp. W8]|uniref:hypothetical protein n=1 Tax=Lewinella sp. W8 TaxID=2528208 RepID=UPI001068169E|nr:hypothetical protein [Lewinella sp. W8]MTB49456.1 hypothetical protein [Lewinella sp. W8]
MDFRAQLLSEHSRANADLLLDHLERHPEDLTAFMEHFFGREVVEAQRAAMVVGDLGRRHPDRLIPFHLRLIEAAGQPVHPAIRRNVLRYFSEIPLALIAEEPQGHLLDLAFRVTASPADAVAMRVFAMQIVANFCTLYPELKDELRGVIENQIAEGASAGFLSRGRKILAKL